MAISLNAAAVAAAGVAVPAMTAQRAATMFVESTAGAQFVVTMEGTVDGTNWIEVGEYSLSSRGYINAKQDGPVCGSFRANLRSITAGTVTANVISGMAGVGGGAEWQRPIDWPAMPLTQVNRIEVLAAVSDDDSNFCAVRATAVGGYTVDWGDGVVENVASATQRDHKYTFSTLSSAVTAAGYKTVMIRIYPQAAVDITAFTLGLKNATAGLAAYSNPWLDIQVNVPACTSMAYRGAVNSRWLQRVNIVSMGAVGTLDSVFLNCSALQVVNWPVPFPSVNSLASAFQGCGSLLSMDFPVGSLAPVVTISGAFNACPALQYVTFPDGSLSLLTNMGDAFNSDFSLKYIGFPAGAFASLTNVTTAFANCTNISEIVNCSIPINFTLACNISAAELNAIYTALPVAVAKTLTCSANYGFAASNQAIATGKGWTLA